MRFPLVAPTPAEARLRAEVRALVAAELPLERRTTMGMAAGYDPEFSRRIATRGWVGMAIPAEYGGRGASAVERFVVSEELFAAQAPISSHWVGDRQTAPTILRFGSEALRRRFLPAIARGECFFSIGMSEPDAGSDLAAVRTRAIRADGGWTVSGTKLWTTGADKTDYFVALCRTSPLADDRHAGLSQLIVDLGSPGVRISPITTMDGDRDFCEVVLDGVHVPDDMVLGEIGEGWRQVTGELAYERYGPERWMSVWGIFAGFVDALCATDDAAAAAAVPMGRLAVRYRVIRNLSLAVARLIDAGERAEVEAVVVKDLGTRFEQEVVETVRLLLDRELDLGAGDRLGRLLARGVLTAPMFTLRGGTTEILRSVLARGLRS